MTDGFRDRKEAGQSLARKLEHLSSAANPIVLALPRGGVPVAHEVAQHLHFPMKPFLVRKLGVPGHEEFAMGALASGGIILLNDEVVGQLGISSQSIDFVVKQEERELERREKENGGSLEPGELTGRTVILVDDGLATGSTMKVAVAAVRKRQPTKLVVAVPVAPASAREQFEAIADEFVSVLEPELFYAVGQWYENFSQTTDEEVRELLGQQGQALTSR